MDIGQQIKQAFEAKGLAAELGELKPSQRSDLCDFVCNGAFAGAARLQTKPLDLANDIVASLDIPSEYKVEVAGKGFINVTVSNQWILDQLAALYGNTYYDGTVVLDYGGANVAKPMHVGHLRSLVLGDSLSRIAQYLGYQVVRDVHLGDWGLQMGMLLASGKQADHISDLVNLYVDASNRAKEDESFKLAAQEATVKLQSFDPDALEKWQKFVGLSVASIQNDCAALGVTFDLWLGESDAAEWLPDTIDILGETVRESEGALVVGDDPPLILKNQAGAWLYGATDLATINARQAMYSPNEIIYVVDERQALHFKQVFAAGQILTQAKLTHVGFGTVNGADGKPYKTRAGGTPTLGYLLAQAGAKASERIDDPHLARKVALAAVKFSDLQSKRTTNYVFDLDRALSHEGHTGVYLLYAVTRINSIEAKASVPVGQPALDTQLKRQIGLTLANFDKVLLNAWQNKMPHFLCDHLLTLASMFSQFYAQENIGGDSHNLGLALLVREQLKVGLGLLGIETVKSM
jgi:arginyl-tRNA synthetase